MTTDTATAEVTTESVIAGMLQENTGRHFLDSGDAYGRNWQRNQGVDFSALPATALSFKYGGIEVTHHVYHWLVERLSYEQAGDEAFYEWANAREGHWLGDMEEWAHLIGGTGLYGDGKPTTVNTYNGEDLVSQTLQYTFFSLDRETVLPPADGLDPNVSTCAVCEDGYDPEGGVCADCDGEGTVVADGAVTLSSGTYVLLQIHGGADVRGGYTRPRLFAVDEETALFDNARAYIQCSEDHEHNWSTDDACHWYDNGTSGLGSGTQLEDYDRVEVALGGVPPWEHFADDDVPDGELVVDTDTDTGYCPRCGVGTLSAYA